MYVGIIKKRENKTRVKNIRIINVLEVQDGNVYNIRERRDKLKNIFYSTII